MSPYYKEVSLGKIPKWKEGEVITSLSFDPNHEISHKHGILTYPSLFDVVRHQKTPSEYCLVEPLDPQIKNNKKSLCGKVKCLRFINQEELDEIAGFKLWEANHPVDPLFLERDETLDLEKLLREWIPIHRAAMDSVLISVDEIVGYRILGATWDSIRDSVWKPIMDSIWISVTDFIEKPAWNFLWASIRSSAYAYMGGLFPNIKEWEHVEKLGPDPWRPLLTLWYGGYLPSFDGNTWSLHVGEKAEVVFELKI